MKNLIFGGRNIIIGRGAIESLKEIKAAKAFIVTGGRSMLESGVIARIEGILMENGCETYIYHGIKKNPDTDDVLVGVAKMKDFKPDLLLAVGGGSPMDAAKVMGLMYEQPHINFTNVLTVELPAKRNKLKFIAIPSTSGTASEVTRAAVITFRENAIKIGIKTPAFIPDIAILDADLTMTMPDNVVAETGMDALTHAVESYINGNLDDFTECMARGAVEGLFTYLPQSYQRKTIDSREKVHHYQCLAGLAFDNVGLGMAHGISHAIGGMFDLGHGLTNAIALPYVLKFNSQNEQVASRLAVLAQSIGQRDFIKAVENLNLALNIPRSFKEAGITAEQFKGGFAVLVQNSLKGATRINPVQVSEAQMAYILTCIFEGRSLDAELIK